MNGETHTPAANSVGPKIKLLLYSKLFPNREFPHFATFVRERARQLARHTGAQITVVAPIAYFPFYRRGSDWETYTRVAALERDEDFEVYHPRFPVIRGASLWLQGFSMYLATLRTCRRLHEKHGFGWVDGHFVYPDGLAAVLTARALRIRASVTARGSDINLFSTYRHIRPMIRHTLRRADLLVAVSNDLAQRMKLLGAAPEKIHVVPNAVDRDLFRILPRDECRAKLGLACDATILLSIGNLLPEKNHSLLIRAMKDLCRTYPHLSRSQLHLIGEGPLLDRLRSLVTSSNLEGNVWFHGILPQRSLAEWYNAANVFCLPSLREGNPNVLLEALACGVPIAASRINSLPEIVRPGVNGYLFDPGDSASMITALEQALSRNWDRDAISQSYAHTWEAASSVLFNLYTQNSPAHRLARNHAACRAASVSERR